MTDSSTRDRAEGMFDEGKGNLKQGVGDLTGNDRMKGEGMLDEMKGKGEGLLGDLKDAAGDLMDDAGKMKDDVDHKTR
ncbi:MAG TPA: CsbD family protein [Thermomicrobiales bacterium]|nr:CsbD family protein [Thermomicrobiales bacterium]